jgi:PAS domain S-box-containing protein
MNYDQMDNRNLTTNNNFRQEINTLKDNNELISDSLRIVEKLAVIGHWNWDYETNKISWSDEIFSIFGVSRDSFEVSADNFKKVLHPDDIDRFITCLRTSLSDRKDVSILHRIIRPDGEIRTVLARTTILNKNNCSGIIFGTSQDITDQIKSVQKIKENEERLKCAFEGIHDGVWDWNMKTDEVYYSSDWKSMLGYSDNEITNQLSEWAKRIHPDDMKDTFKAIQLHKEGITSCYSNTHRVLCKGGSYKWVLDRGRIIEYSNDGKPLRMIGTHTDLTDRIEIETKLIKLNADKDRFISILAHDLKNPFNPLLGLSDFLLKEIHTLDKKQIEEQLCMINKSAHQIYNLLDDLLLWSSAQAGKLAFLPQKIIFNEICHEVIESLELQASCKGISIRCDNQDHLAMTVDLNMFKTIIRNLVSNAIKFTKDGGLVTINAETKNECVLVTISDNGIGIESQNLANLWNQLRPFSTFGTDNEDGKGLGLLLCKEFVEQHGGKIWVESTPGKGSNFKFTIPISCNPKTFN